MRRAERGGRLMVSVTPSGFPVCDGSVYRGCAIAPPPACDPSLLRSFHFGWYVRGTCTGVALPLHRLPVVFHPYGVYPELAYNTLERRC